MDDDDNSTTVVRALFKSTFTWNRLSKECDTLLTLTPSVLLSTTLNANTSSLTPKNSIPFDRDVDVEVDVFATLHHFSLSDFLCAFLWMSSLVVCANCCTLKVRWHLPLILLMTHPQRFFFV